MAVNGGTEKTSISSKDLHLCSKDEWKSFGFGTTWGWGINDRIFHFWV